MVKSRNEAIDEIMKDSTRLVFSRLVRLKIEHYIC